MNGLVEFLKARLDEDEAWALAASRPYKHADAGAVVPAAGVHWQWVVGEDWDRAELDPALNEFVAEPGHSCNLQSVETWAMTTRIDDERTRTSSRPKTYADDIVEMDAAAAGHIVRHDPARVLREVEAKRAIVERCVYCMEHEDYGHWLAAEALRLLAQPYRDHPDYRQEWAA